METFFAYARILRKKSQKLPQEVQARRGQVPPPPSGQPTQAKRKAGLLERLRLASACQNTDP
jgi:hypothetical protein